MAVALPRVDEGSLNMTPMIDIVFQLILFFLFNLRFKSLDWRIESTLPQGGPGPGPIVEVPSMRVSVFRLDADEPDRARTKIKFGGREWIAPPLEDEAARDVFYARLAATFEALKPERDARGEIDSYSPTGGLVPHGDVVRVVDAFLAAGIPDVVFQGTPMPRRARD